MELFKREDENIKTVEDLIRYACENFEKKTAISYMINRRKEKVDVTYGKLYSDTKSFRNWINSKYDNRRIGILSENSYFAIQALLALIDSNNVAVPFDKGLDLVDLKALMEDCGCSVLLYSKDYKDVADKLREELEFDMYCLEELVDMANQESADESERITKDFDAIFYTSGTTGKSKGVCLTSEGLMFDLKSSVRLVNVEDRGILVLPLNHAFGLVGGVLAYIYFGCENFINSSLRFIAEDIQMIKPTDLMLVPLYLESFYGKIRTMLGIDVSTPLTDEMKAKILHGVFGGCLKQVISGGAPLNKMYIAFYENLGIKIVNGYGITECSPVVSVNYKGVEKLESIGYPVSGVEVKIDKPSDARDGEILVKGPNVMKGYYHMPEETSKVIQDGWFRTGDRGYLDEDGFLYITGREKNLIILSNGENVSPEELENLIQPMDMVGEVIVYEKDGNIVAQIFPDMEYLQKLGLEDIKKIICDYVSEINQKLPVYKRISKTEFRDKEFEKTTTKKVIRNMK